MSHTPTPWERYHLFVFKGGAEGANICACGDPRASSEVGYTPPSLGSDGLHEAAANAEFIVRAVNNHEALLEAAQRVLRLWDDPQDLGMEVYGSAYEALREAIEKASG